MLRKSFSNIFFLSLPQRCLSWTKMRFLHMEILISVLYYLIEIIKIGGFNLNLLTKNYLRFILLLFLIYMSNISAKVEYDAMGIPLSDNTIDNDYLSQISYDLRFTIDDTLEIPTNLDPGPGQLSKDGLEYYLDINDILTENHLYVMKRSEIGQPFGQLEKLGGKINEMSIYNFQPTITSDKKTFVFVISKECMWSSNDLYMAIRSDTTLPFDSVRPLVEINDTNNADSYPCITSDGLKLYYTKEVNDTSKLFYSARSSTSDIFSPPQLLDIENYNGQVFSAWLSNDGIHLFFSSQGNEELFYSNRPNLMEPFKTPELLTDFEPFGLVCGASMIIDEFYVRCGSNPDHNTLKFISDSLTIDIKENGQQNIDILNSSSILNIIPNPIRSLATIKSNCNIRSAKLDIYNLKGELVYILSEINGNQIIWDAELLPPGPYFVSLKVDKTSHNQKILLIK